MKPFRVIPVLFLIAFLTSELLAIPAFARKYNMSCATCHSPVPRLKAYGEDFAGNAFQLEGEEPPRYTRDTGDETLTLLREIPIAVRFDAYLRYRQQPSDRSDFQSPYLIKLLSGGKIANDVAYYFYFFLGERGKVAGLEDAYVMFNNVLGIDFDVYVGQFQASDPLFKRELRLSLEDYQIYKVRPGLSAIDLTYDRGIMLTYGLETGTDIMVQVLNGSGIGAADASRNFDTDKHKNGMFRVSQSLGKALRVGGFAYVGKEESIGRLNSTTMAGPDLTLSTEHLEVNIQYVYREDTNPYFRSFDDLTATGGGFAEAILTPDGDDSKWYAVLLLNSITSDYPGFDCRTMTVHGSYLLARNLRLAAEWTYDDVVDAHSISLGLVTGF
jgi:hypothetical protein